MGRRTKVMQIWDAKHPGTLNSAYGPCPQPGAQGPCGATFFPDAADCASYVSKATLMILSNIQNSRTTPRECRKVKALVG